jgi:STE24 endopeptidase
MSVGSVFGEGISRFGALARDLDLSRVAIGFVAGVAAVELCLSLRQRRLYAVSRRPRSLDGIADDETFAKSQRYNLDRNTHGIVTGLFSHATTAALLGLRVLPRLHAAVCGRVEGDMPRALAFAGATVLLSTALNLPGLLWSTFGVEERHGFNKTTLRTFVADRFKTLLVTGAIATPAVCGIHWIVTRAGPMFWLPAWGFTFAVSVVATLLAPTLIMPLFNEYTPVPEGSLRDRVYALASSLDYPLKELYVMDGSKRSAHSNAFLFGLGSTKRIVLFDTLETQVGEAGIVSILAHELGHWAHSDTYRGLAVGQVHSLLFFALFGTCAASEQLFRDFGFAGVDPARAPIVGLILFGYLFAPIDTVFMVAFNAVIRSMEFAADRFAAVKVGVAGDLREALIALHRENLSSMIVDPWFSAFHHSHPTLPERLAAIDAAAARKRKGE